MISIFVSIANASGSRMFAARPELLIVLSFNVFRKRKRLFHRPIIYCLLSRMLLSEIYISHYKQAYLVTLFDIYKKK